MIARGAVLLTAAILLSNCGSSSSGAVAVPSDQGAPTGHTTAERNTAQWYLFAPSGAPIDIIVGPDQNLWFTEAGSGPQGLLGRITTAGAIAEYPLPDMFPGPLAAGADGNFYVGDAEARFMVVSPSGVAQLFSLNDGSANPISSMTLGPDGLVWFSQIDLLGTIAPDFTVHTYALPQPSPHVSSIARGGDGEIWFVDYVDNIVGKIDPATKHITTYALSPSICESPTQIVHSGTMWFSCHNGSTSILVEMSTSGAILGSFPAPNIVGAIAPGPSLKVVWYLGRGSTRYGEPKWSLNRMNGLGLTQTFKQPNPNDNEFETQGSIVTGPDGNLWYTQQTPDEIGKFVK